MNLRARIHRFGLNKEGLLLAMFLFSSPWIGAQTRLGRAVFEVRDQQSELVAGVEIELRSDQTHFSGRTLTNQDGRADFRDLPFGTYLATVQDDRFDPIAVPIKIRSEVTLKHVFHLKVRSLAEEVAVEDSLTPLDPQQTGNHLNLGEKQLRQRSFSIPNRETTSLIASLPGWVLEANGILHPRGSEYQTQFVIDGVPLSEKRAPGFAAPPLAEAVQSVEVITAGIPAEHGRKLGGIVKVTSAAGHHAVRNEFDVQGGSHDLLRSTLRLFGGCEKWNIALAGSAAHTDRYLDPPGLENLHNQANAASGFFRLDYLPTTDSVLRLSAWTNGAHLQVPNEPFQDQAGQDQVRRSHDQGVTVRWDRYYPSQATTTLGVFWRAVASALKSNEHAVPSISRLNTQLQVLGMNGAVSWVRGDHELKLGGDVLLAPASEDFEFSVTQPEFFETQDGPAAILNYTPAHPFVFRDRRSSFEYSFFAQDRWRWRNLTVQAGLRYDGYRFLVRAHGVSPRIGVAYHFPSTSTRFHFAYDRVLQTPSTEGLMLSSSAQARSLQAVTKAGAVGGKPVPTSRGNFYEVGFTQMLAGEIRLSGQVFRRDVWNFEDDDVFFNTGLSFPITIAKAEIRGAELRLELPSWRGLSTYASYSNLLGYGSSPVTGGLFIGEEARELLESGLRFPLSQDQRNTANARFHYQPSHSRWWLAAGTRYESGLPVELSETPDESTSESGRLLLERVDLSRGRVKPRLLFDVSSGLRLYGQEQRRLSVQLDLVNVTDRFYLVNFNGLFSGTAVGLGRTTALKLSYQF
ncbi:MAG: TonB-dependent receptor [Acidobacteriota bacterium]